MWKWNPGIIPRIFFLKTSTLNAVTPKVTELNNRKYQNKTSCISSQRKIMKPMNSRKRKSFKKLQVQTRVRNYFSFKFSTLNRGVWNVREKRWGKQSYQATSREEKPIKFWRIVLLTHCAHVYTLQPTRVVIKSGFWNISCPTKNNLDFKATH